MLRRFARAITAAGILLATTSATQALPAQAEKPNFVFILIDDLGYNDIGCYGSTFHETPRIDRLAASGMRFTDGYAACPVCSPTRASIQCGKYPARLHLTNFLKGRRTRRDSPVRPPSRWADQMELEEVTLAEVLAAEGYATGFFGKWHLGGEPYFPGKQGYDRNVGGCQSGMPRSFFWPRWGNNPPIEGRFEGEYLPDRLADETSRFIRENRERPFLAFLSHYSVHIPLEAKEDKIAKYRRKLEERPETARVQDNPIYAAMVESIDDSVGQVLDTLDELQLADRTVVFFTSDNGGLVTREGRHTPATDLAPLRAGKGYLYEGGIREPWIVRWPGVTPPGSVCREVVTSTDFFPTMVQIAGIESVDTPGVIDGVSLVPLLREPTAKLSREAVFWHYPHFSNQGGRPGGAVRRGDLKLIERYEDGSLELYDLGEDLSETKNLAESRPDAARALQELLAAWRRDVGAQDMEPNPTFRKR